MTTTQEALDNLFGTRRRVETSGVSVEDMRAHNAGSTFGMPRPEDSEPPSLKGVPFGEMIDQLTRHSLLSDDQKDKLRALAKVVAQEEENALKRAIAICNEPPNGWDTSKMAQTRRENGPIGKRLIESSVRRSLPAPRMDDGYDGLRNA